MKELIRRNQTLFIVILVILIAFYWYNQRPSPIQPFLETRTGLGAFPSEFGGEYEKGVAPELATTSDVNLQTTTSEDVSSPSDQLIIKTGTLSILVKNVRESVESIRDLSRKLGGFVTNSDISEREGIKGSLKATITIRVPAEKFDLALKDLKDSALKVKSEKITGQDVTEEYTDLQSRLRNLEATEEQLLQIMKRAGEIKDVLEVQKELTRIREQIETTKGRIKYLEESAQLSSITIYLATEEEELPLVEERWKPLATAKAGMRALITFWQNIADRVIFWGIFLTPIILVGLIIWLIRQLRKSSIS